MIQATKKQLVNESLYKYADTVFRIAYQNLNNKAESESVIQKVFTKLLHADITSDEHVKAWLIKAAIKTSSGFKRKHSITSDNDKLEVFESLPLKCRNVIYLYYYEKYTTQEISSQLGISTVKVSELLKVDLQEDAYFKAIDEIKVSDEKLDEISKRINEYYISKNRNKWITKAASFILLILMVIRIYVGESRELTLDDFKQADLSQTSQANLNEYVKKIVVRGDTEEPKTIFYDGMYGGGMSLEHKHYELSNSFGKEGPYFRSSASVNIKSNRTNIPHPLDIKIGTDFKTVMRRIKLSKISISKVKELEPGEIKYIEGSKSSEKSVYIYGTYNSYDYLYSVVEENGAEYGVYAFEKMESVLPFTLSIFPFSNGSLSICINDDTGVTNISSGIVVTDAIGYVYKLPSETFVQLDERQWLSRVVVEPIEVMEFHSRDYMDKVILSGSAKEVKQISESVSPCGLVCKLCHFSNMCSGCISDNNCCGKRKSQEGCYQYNCCTEKGINGCWQCDIAPCERGMFSESHDLRLRAFIAYIKENGRDRLADRLYHNAKKGIYYGHDKDYDNLDSIESVIKRLNGDL